MNVFKSLTPIEDNRHVLARVGLRFIFCTGPYFLTAIIAQSFGSDRLFAMWPALFMLAIPFTGGLLDWFRLHKSVGRVENGAA